MPLTLSLLCAKSFKGPLLSWAAWAAIPNAADGGTRAAHSPRVWRLGIQGQGVGGALRPGLQTASPRRSPRGGVSGHMSLLLFFTGVQSSDWGPR